MGVLSVEGKIYLTLSLSLSLPSWPVRAERRVGGYIRPPNSLSPLVSPPYNVEGERYCGDKMGDCESPNPNFPTFPGVPVSRLTNRDKPRKTPEAVDFARDCAPANLLPFEQARASVHL